jgi:hypothetical protein
LIGNEICYEISQRDIAWNSHQNPASINTWETDLKEVPTTYERMMYGAEREMAVSNDIIGAGSTQQATQILSKLNAKEPVFGDMGEDLSFMGSWVEDLYAPQGM